MGLAVHHGVEKGMMAIDFEWDQVKADKNRKKHGVSFDDAVTVFADPFSITIPDPDHSVDEQRFVDIGTSAGGAVLVVVYTERGDSIRIISCRKATGSERQLYEEGDY